LELNLLDLPKLKRYFEGEVFIGDEDECCILIVELKFI
jgi:hypothetical protein